MRNRKKGRTTPGKTVEFESMSFKCRCRTHVVVRKVQLFRPYTEFDEVTHTRPAAKIYQATFLKGNFQRKL